MIQAFDTYSLEEQQTLADVGGVFLKHVSLWKIAWGNTYIMADHVELGPRRWSLVKMPGRDWSPEEFQSPYFGNLDSLLVWAKLEGLL